MMINVVHCLKVVFTVTKVKKNYTVVEFKNKTKQNKTKQNKTNKKTNENKRKN